MGGSFVQAEIVYGYFTDYCDIDASIVNHVDGGQRGITMTETKSVSGYKFSCVTASPKQVRGKHPDILIADEACEISDELIHSALPMINDSKHPLVIMASTFHKIFGIFQETWDNAEERGYLRIQWDIFDVVQPFTDAVWDDPQYAKISGMDKLREYAKERHGDPEGWIPIENVIQAWREKPTLEWFEVEYMGSRPSSAGLVLKPEDVDRARFDSTIDSRYHYMYGATVVLGIDWGFSTMTSVVELMGCADSVVAMLDNKNYHQTGSDDIIKDVVAKVKSKGIRFIYADSAGKFENHALQVALNKENIACTVVEVVFSKEKEGMLGNLRAHFEQSKFKLPKKIFRNGDWVSNDEAYWQYKRYRYQDNSDKPVKKDDHIPDSTMCALQHFKLNAFVRALPVKVQAKKQTEEVKPMTAGLQRKSF